MNFNFIIGNKKAIFSISLILMLSMMLMMAFAQPSLAQVFVPQPEKTVGYISVAPTLVGVGQTATLNAWAYPLPTTYDLHPFFKGFYGVTVTFVRPDGTKDTFMPVDGTHGYDAGEMSSLGSMFFFYEPNMAGNWSISFTMPAQNITDSSGTVQFLGCTSNTAYFTVQTEPVLAGLLNGYPWAELPNANVYWSYPINDNNREWSQISGDWTGVSATMAMVNSPTALRWQPYGSGPNTAHIVWSNPIRVGGMVGGAYGSISYTAGLNYLPVMDGKVYVNIPFNVPGALAFSPSGNLFQCFDEFTGKLLYTANGSITCGLHLPGSTYQQASLDPSVLLAGSYGSYQYPYLFGTVAVAGVTYWNYYDPMTGVLVRTINNASAARLIDGTVLAFGAQGPLAAGVNPALTGYVYRWNMTSVVNNNWITGITWKTPLPTPGAYPRAMQIFAVSSDLSTVVVYNYNQFWAYNANTGASIWNITLNYPITTNEEIPLINVDDFVVFDAVAATWHAYSIKTGAELWETPSFANYPWATTQTVYNSVANDLNNLYLAQPDGAVRAYSLTDGHLVWTSKAIPSTEYANNVIPTVMGGLVLVDGKVYVYAGYSISYQIDPVPRFAHMQCINATTGDTIYILNGGVAPSAAANGYVIGTSIFDGQLFCLGKGPTSTTVTAQQQVGGSVLIQGSVLDKSTVSSSAPLTAKFANGVPAISDADMSVWMDYLHMQNATLLNNPPICIGVPVTLTAVDPNGNVNVIGTATTNYQGNYNFQWTPTTQGLYTIYATFTGSNSYYTSSDSTGATVATAAATATPAPTNAPSNFATTTDLMTYIVVGVIAMIIAIAVATVLILRKK